MRTELLTKANKFSKKLNEFLKIGISTFTSAISTVPAATESRTADPGGGAQAVPRG